MYLRAQVNFHALCFGFLSGACPANLLRVNMTRQGWRMMPLEVSSQICRHEHGGMAEWPIAAVLKP